MNYSDALNYIHSLEVFGSRPGLTRISELLEVLGNPQNDIKFIHVAGTNGKGSVCTMMSYALRSAGYKTGLYISPYVTCFRERIQINGEYIAEKALARLTEKVRNTGIEVTEFEFITALAFLYYKEQNCDVVVLETGLGGRLDATNVIENPLLSVITGIDMDHMGVLGDTYEKIAHEKCGIIKNGCPVCTTYKQRPEVMKVISGYKSPIVPDEAQLKVLDCNLSGNKFIYKGKEYGTTLIGEHQIENAILVIEVLENCGLPVSYEQVKEGIAKTTFPARLERIGEKPTVLLDGAHNPHGAKALERVLAKLDNITLIMGMMKDKDCEEVVKILVPHCKRVLTVTVNENPRTISAVDLAALASKYCKDVTPCESYDDALKKVRGEETIVIAGSLYLASAIRPLAIEFYN